MGIVTTSQLLADIKTWLRPRKTINMSRSITGTILFLKHQTGRDYAGLDIAGALHSLGFKMNFNYYLAVSERSPLFRVEGGDH